MSLLTLAWRQMWRELRAGELRLLFAALVLAVAAVSAVGFFSDRVRLALVEQAQQLMGGDLVLNADQPLPPDLTAEAVQRGLKLAETRVFPSMVLADSGAQLADIKAVTASYPLRGELGVDAQAVTHGPEAGTVWLDERLAQALKSRVGEQVGVGRLRLRVAGILTDEPDRGVNFFSLAPRLMMSVDDLPATGLVQFGSRIRYRLLLAGEASALAAYKDWLTPRLERGQKLEDGSNARPEIRTALDRTERFLGLSGVLTVVLAAVAVAMSARRYMQRHLDACAIMRCLGMTHRRLLGLHGLIFLGLALQAALLGGAIGYLAHFLLVDWLGGLLAFHLPPPGGQALMDGGLVAAVLVFGFAFPPLLRLAAVPTLRVLRHELGDATGAMLGGHLLGLGLLALLILRVAGDRKLGWVAVAGFALAFAIFWVLARLAVALLSRLRGGLALGWRQGLANLGRHAGSATAQIVALSVGLMAMLLLTVTRGELLAAWQQTVPADAPNHFIINIQPEQRADVQQALASGGIKAALEPMIRARLVQIGERRVDASSYPDDERAQRLIEREFNLSWRADLPQGNTVVAGHWFSAGNEASVEEGLAKSLGIKLGDQVVFSVAGQHKTLQVSSLRKLSWDSMRVNFFVITPPGVLEDAPASYITSFHLDSGQARALDALVGQFPNLTVINIAAVLGQLQRMIDRMVLAIQFIFAFACLAGAVVLYAAMLTAFDERRHELAVMRALGASRQQLRSALLLEFGLVGAVAGVIAAGAAIALGQVIGQQVFQLAPAINWALLPAAALLGAAFVLSVAWLAINRLLATAPLLVLRAAA